MYKACLLPLLILVLATLPLLAQKPAQPQRIELELDPEKTEVEVMATADSSLLVYTRTQGSWATKPIFEFSKFNYQLEPQWSKKVELYQQSRYMAHYSAPSYTYVVLSGEKRHDFQFLKLDQQTGAVTKRELRIDAIDSVYVFKVLDDNYFLVSRSAKDGSPMLLHLNERSGEVKPLPAAYGTESTFSDILAHHPQHQVSVVMSESNGRVSRLQTKLFDTGGTLLGNYFILPRPDKRPLAAEATPGDTTQRLLIGTYTNRNLNYATGFFTVPVTSDGSDARFYSFLQLKNFFKHMKPRREERLRKREVARLETGKEPALQYRVLLHDVYPTSEGYILTAEIYFPESGNSNYTRIYTITGGIANVPKRYRRTQAIALGFDREGILLWDNSFPLKDLESHELKPTVEVVTDQAGNVVMAHPGSESNSEIFYQYMHQDTYIDEETKFSILPKDADAKILSNSVSGIISWYGLNFAAFGWHRVKFPGSEARSVFYLNKVAF
ncbi:MAG TPA: hypothetical protein VIG72_03245 [Pontibacter sp.]